MRIPGGPKPALVEINQCWTYELGGQVSQPPMRKVVIPAAMPAANRSR